MLWFFACSQVIQQLMMFVNVEEKVAIHILWQTYFLVLSHSFISSPTTQIVIFNDCSARFACFEISNGNLAHD